MVIPTKSFRLPEKAKDVIEQHRLRNRFVTDTEALIDIIFQFEKYQASRLKKMLETMPEIRRVLLSDFMPPASQNTEA